MSYLPDVAGGLITLGTHEEALGEIWHLPSNAPITGRRFIEMVYAEAGAEPSMRAYGYWALTLAGLFDTQISEAREVLYQFQEPFVMDTHKFEAAFGRDVTSYETAIRETLDWHRRHRDCPPPFLTRLRPTSLFPESCTERELCLPDRSSRVPPRSFAQDSVRTKFVAFTATGKHV